MEQEKAFIQRNNESENSILILGFLDEEIVEVKMIKLVEVNEENWIEVIRLSVSDEQQKYLDRPIGIIARGYIYRDANARVIGIKNDNQMVGVALVKDMDEEPACYDLQQFMIDWRFQNKGYGTEALQQILSMLREEAKYECVEVCVHKTDASALRVYEKIGFVDTGYIDERIPDCLNLMVTIQSQGNFQQKHELCLHK